MRLIVFAAPASLVSEYTGKYSILQLLIRKEMESRVRVVTPVRCYPRAVEFLLCRLEPAFSQIVVFEEDSWVVELDEPRWIEWTFPAERVEAACTHGQASNMGNPVELGRPDRSDHPDGSDPHGRQYVAVVERDGKEPSRGALRQ